MNKYLFFFAMVVSACEPPPPRNVIVLCSDGDAGAPEPFEADRSEEALGLSTPCAKACKRLSELGCPEAWKLPAGRTCVENCKAMKPVSPYDPECVMKAKDVEVVRKCPALTCQK